LVGGAVGRSEAEGGESVTESHRGRRHRPDGGLGRMLRALPSFPTRLQKRSQIVVQLLQPIARSELIPVNDAETTTRSLHLSGEVARFIMPVQMSLITALAIGQELRELRRDPDAEPVSVGEAS
jgi:hypothetical protein